MGELKDTEAYEEELIDYEEEDEKVIDSTKPATEAVKKLVSSLFFILQNKNNWDLSNFLRILFCKLSTA